MLFRFEATLVQSQLRSKNKPNSALFDLPM